MTTKRSTTWGGRSTTWGGRSRITGSALALAVLAAPAAAALPHAGPPSDGGPTTVASRGLDTPVFSTGSSSEEKAARKAARNDAKFAKKGNAPTTRNEAGPAAVSENAERPRMSVRDLIGAGGLGRGAGTTIAVVDSGVAEVPALAGRVVQGFDATGLGFADAYGHGTFVAGLAAGNGLDANKGQTGLLGVAPAARILSVKVSDEEGRSSVGDVVTGLQWLVTNHERYGVDVAVLALAVQAEEAESYDDSPINALVEALWLEGVTVVASAGNDGTTVKSAPGNDPMIITTGTAFDANTASFADDSASIFSNKGETKDKVVKPEVTTVGQHVRAPLPASSRLASRQTTPGLPAGYGQMSGTSMSAAVLGGAAALLENSDDDGITPGQVKARLMATKSAGIGQVDLAAAFRSTAQAAPLPRVSAMLAMAYAQGVLGTDAYANVTWSNVTWSNVTWSNVTWSNVTWSNATWSSGLSTNATWSSATWSNATWSSATWSSATWSSATWSSGAAAA